MVEPVNRQGKKMQNLRKYSVYHYLCVSKKKKTSRNAVFSRNDTPTYTDKKENKIFLIYMKNQKGAVAKSCMTVTASSYMN
jgi:hypothetical protein